MQSKGIAWLAIALLIASMLTYFGVALFDQCPAPGWLLGLLSHSNFFAVDLVALLWLAVHGPLGRRSRLMRWGIVSHLLAVVGLLLLFILYPRGPAWNPMEAAMVYYGLGFRLQLLWLIYYFIVYCRGEAARE